MLEQQQWSGTAESCLKRVSSEIKKNFQTRAHFELVHTFHPYECASSGVQLHVHIHIFSLFLTIIRFYIFFYLPLPMLRAGRPKNKQTLTFSS